MKHSDYIVFVDESGDHSLDSINERYPIFVLSLCVFKKETYIYEVAPAVSNLKFSFFGHDSTILHEYEIRKKRGAFQRLGKEPRESFLEALHLLIQQADFILIPIVVDKLSVKKSGIDAPNVYHLAMQYGLEMLYKYLQDCGQEDLTTHIVFEARGKTEDLALEMEFRRVCDYQNSELKSLPFEIVVTDKKANACGLQVADLVARPIGLSVLRPNQPNRAVAAIQDKLYRRVNHFERKFSLSVRTKESEFVLGV